MLYLNRIFQNAISKTVHDLVTLIPVHDVLALIT